MRLFRAAGNRFWVIDFFRGLSVLLMIAFHFAYDLNWLGVIALDFFDGFGWVIPRLIAGSFMFLAGLSLTISYSRDMKKMRGEAITRKFVMRGLRIFAWGMLITVMTALLLGSGTVWFGVLHLIGISVIVARPLVRYRYTNLFLGMGILAAGFLLHAFVFPFPWMLPLGFVPAGFFSYDYAPLLPYAGVVLLGVYFGNSVYPRGRAAGGSVPRGAGVLCWMGRNSLFIYLLHQPVLIALLYMLFA